jgi:hypothetical protein
LLLLLETMHLSVIPVSSQKDSFSDYQRASQGTFLWNMLLYTNYITTCQLQQFSLFQRITWKKSFTFSLDAIHHCDYTFIFFISYLMIQCCMKPCLLFGFHHFHVSEELKLLVISCQQHLVYSSLDLLKPL